MYKEEQSLAKAQPFKLQPLKTTPTGTAEGSFLRDGCWHLFCTDKKSPVQQQRSWSILNLSSLEQEEICRGLNPQTKGEFQKLFKHRIPVSDSFFYGEHQHINYPKLAVYDWLEKIGPALLLEKGMPKTLERLAKSLKAIEPTKYGWNNLGKFFLQGFSRFSKHQEIAELLLDMGAIVKEHNMKIPQYKSWASVKNGTSIELQTNEFVLNWVVPTKLNLTSEPNCSDPDLVKKYGTKQNITLKASLQQVETVFYKGLDSLSQKTILLGEVAKQKTLHSLQKAFSGKTFEIPHIDEKKHTRRFLQRQSLLQKTAVNQSIYGDLVTNFESYMERKRVGLLIDYCLNQLWEASEKTFFKTNTWNLEQIAPFSERGRLTISLFENVQIEDVVEKLAQLGFCAWQKTSNIVLSPLHTDYIQKPNTLVLPKDFLVMHGLTGVRNVNEAQTRFEDIVQHGGLLSYSERRRYGLRHYSMSPVGDLASGIDWGVPCTISNRPSYGKLIVFIINPRVLKRRHLFFSDRDFGGGRDRHLFYTNYAKSIGQDDYFVPPDHEARKRHLENITNNGFNEVWLRWIIEWKDIEAVVVSSQGGLYENIEAKLKTAQEKGLVPNSTRLYKFHNHQYNLEQEAFQPSESMSLVLKQVIFDAKNHR